MSTEVLPCGPCDYVALPPIPDHWKVLDVGPGAYPLLRANLHVDWRAEILAPLAEMGLKTLQADINAGLPEIADKAFDYVWCSHLLEHVDDPAACAATLSRVAKSGTIVMPSAVKEAMFMFEESEHQWFVLPHPAGGPPIFVRYNAAWVNRLRNTDIQQATRYLYRLGSDHDLTVEQNMASWFRDHECDLDVVYHWQDELKLMVIG